MKVRYWGLIFVGLLGLILVSIFGILGMYGLNLAIILYFWPKLKPDEREQQLMRKSFSISLSIILIILVNIYVLSHFIAFDNFLVNNWVGMVGSGIFLILGITGLILFFRE